MVHSMFVIENYVRHTAKEKVIKYCADVLTAKTKNTIGKSENVYYGQGSPRDDIVKNLELDTSTKVFYKLSKDECLFESSLKTKQRSNNSHVLLSDGRFVRKHAFLISQAGDEGTMCSIIQTKYFLNNFKKLHVINSIEEKIIVPTNMIDKVCIQMNVNKKDYICPTSNLLHY